MKLRKLKKRKKSTADLDSDRLAWTTEGFSPQATLLIRALWSSRGDVLWCELPDNAFDEGPARGTDTTFEALKRLQKTLSVNYDKYLLVLSISRKKATVTFRKDRNRPPQPFLTVAVG